MKKINIPPTERKTPSLNQNALAVIIAAYKTHMDRFRAISRKASEHFRTRDWENGHQDVLDRITSEIQLIDQAVIELSSLLGEKARDSELWAQIKPSFRERTFQIEDPQLAKTFYNSVVRRLLGHSGFDPATEFTATEFEGLETTPASCPACVMTAHATTFEAFIGSVLENLRHTFAFEDMARDTGLLAAALATRLQSMPEKGSPTVMETLVPLFFRGKGAYIVGRIHFKNDLLPFAVALLNKKNGVVTDALMLTEAEISIIFSYTMSYFRVDSPHLHQLMRFLKTLMPLKKISEIYTQLGFAKHGKAQLFRELQRHMHGSEEAFVIAPGQKGMVMVVFTLPGFDVVFKVIRDRFEAPKKTTRQEVIDQYRRIFHHDRAGRLVDAQKFTQLAFDKVRFTNALLKELSEKAPKSVTITATQVILHQVYTERRVTPLDLYLKDADPMDAANAIISYGWAIKDLAVTNIFPGDLLLKNFGVTRFKRVVFYDYDEICPMTACNFRKIPPSRSLDDEMDMETWFHIDENDVFPEEFRMFMGIPDHLKKVFAEHHQDLFAPEYWQGIKTKIENKTAIHLYPYKKQNRLQA